MNTPPALQTTQRNEVQFAVQKKSNNQQLCAAGTSLQQAYLDRTPNFLDSQCGPQCIST
jgi:hypothetical protein